MRARPLVALLFAALVLGCGPTSEAVSLSFPIDERGAMFSVVADSSADYDIDVEWAIEVDNLGSQPCPVAVYQWATYVKPYSVERPTASDPQDWPETLEDGELIATGVVEVGESLTLGPTLVGEPTPTVYAQFLLATGPDARLDFSVRAEALVDLGVRVMTDSLGLTLVWLD
jgi:hypothetical protein